MMKLGLPILAVAAVASALPQSASTPPPSFKITNIVSGGTGCPQGSIDVKWTDEKVLPISKLSFHSLSRIQFYPIFSHFA